jgi:hypothetical protein
LALIGLATTILAPLNFRDLSEVVILNETGQNIYLLLVNREYIH